MTEMFYSKMCSDLTNEEFREIAGYSIEIWNTLCEEELVQKYKLLRSDNTQTWQAVANLLL
jgi:hypothetical protein